MIAKRFERIKPYISWKNAIKSLLLLVIFIGGYLWASNVDAAAGNTRWMDLYINVFISGVMITIVGAIIMSFSNSKNG